MIVNLSDFGDSGSYSTKGNIGNFYVCYSNGTSEMVAFEIS